MRRGKDKIGEYDTVLYPLRTPSLAVMVGTSVIPDPIPPTGASAFQDSNQGQVTSIVMPAHDSFNAEIDTGNTMRRRNVSKL